MIGCQLQQVAKVRRSNWHCAGSLNNDLCVSLHTVYLSVCPSHFRHLKTAFSALVPYRRTLAGWACLDSLHVTLSALKSTCSPYSITERRVQELIPVLGSQPAGDVSHKPGAGLPLLSASYPRNP